MDTLIALVFAVFILYLLYKEHHKTRNELTETKRRLFEINRRQEIARISSDYEGSAISGADSAIIEKQAA